MLGNWSNDEDNQNVHLSPVLFPGGRNADMSANITCEGRTRKDGRTDG